MPGVDNFVFGLKAKTLCCHLINITITSFTQSNKIKHVKPNFMKKIVLFRLGAVFFTFACLSVNQTAYSQTVVMDTLVSLGGDDWGMSIANTSDGGSVIVGGSYEIISGYGDAIIIKLDANGDTLWTRKYGDGYWQRIYSVQQTSDNGYIVTGNSWDANSQTDTYTLKLDNNGMIVWEKRYGGTGWEATNSVCITNDNSYVIAGRTETYGTGAMSGAPNIYLLKLDQAGDTLWTKAIGGSGWEDALEVKQTADNGYIIVGATSSLGNGTDVYVVKTDANGVLEWERNYGGDFRDEAKHVEILSGGGYVVCGFKDAASDMNGNAINGDAYLLRLNANGDTLWTKTFGGANTEQVNVVRQTSDGGFITAGETESFGESGKNGYLIRTDGNGEEQWTQLIEGGFEDRIHDLVINASGDFLLTGWKNNGADADVLIAKVLDEGNTTGINEGQLATAEFVFPNPTYDYIYYPFAGKQTAYSVCDHTGKIVLKGTLTSGDAIIDVSALSEGVYIFKPADTDRNFKVIKK